jgi:cyclic pyranopterin monophosphate synthase
MGMIDVTEKPVVRRFAAASGRILLSRETIRAIREGKIRKGHPFPVAECAGMNAAKQTHILIPHCHQIALDAVSVTFEMKEEEVKVLCSVRAQARTGVEMEAIVGVTAALYTIWDMVKYLEKDGQGQYPATAITDIRVDRKEKGAPAETR